MKPLASQTDPRLRHRDSPDRRLLRDALVYAPGRLAPAIASLLVLVLATRALSPSEVGRFALAFATIQMIATAVGSWADQAALRFYPEVARLRMEHDFRRHHGRMVIELAGLALGFGGIVVWLVLGAESLTSTDLLLTVGTLVALVALNHAEYVLVAEQRSTAYSTVEGVRGVLNLVGSYAFLSFWRQDATALLAGLFLSTVIPLILATRLASLSLRKPSGASHRAYVGKALRYGIPMVGWFFGYQFLTLSGRYFIQYLRGTEEVGIYHANASVIPGLMPILFTPLLLAAHSVVMRANENHSLGEMEALITRFTRYFLLFAVPLAVGVTAASRPLTQLLVGDTFEPGHVVVPWLVWGLVAWSIGMYGNKRFEVELRTKTLLILVAVCVIIQAILALALVPIKGYLGAAIATAAGYALYPVLVLLAPGARLRWRLPWLTLAKTGAAALAGIAVGAAVSTVAAWLRPLPEAILTGGAAAGVCWVLLLALKEVSVGELARLPLVLTRE